MTARGGFVIPMTERNFSNPAAIVLGGGGAWEDEAVEEDCYCHSARAGGGA